MAARLEPPGGRNPIVLDTDTYNEIDDQFALAYALLSPEAVQVEAVYAAPFHNDRSDGPGDGMLKSYEEIARVLERLGRPPEAVAFRGSERWLGSREEPVRSDAAADLVRRGMAKRDGPLYVLAIGAATNVASALLLEPGLVERIVVVWVAGQPHYWTSASDFNLAGDLLASQVIFHSGVPLVQFPCVHVAEQLRTTLPELEQHMAGRSGVADYLVGITRDYVGGGLARSKVIWDIVTVAWMVEPAWAPTELVHAPLLTDGLTYSADRSRHLMRVGVHVERDAVFADLFRKLGAAG
jgi:inosine-uridine nucleoside N-ribohydrolase